MLKMPREPCSYLEAGQCPGQVVLLGHGSRWSPLGSWEPSPPCLGKAAFLLNGHCSKLHCRQQLKGNLNMLSANFFFQSHLVTAPSLLSCSWCRAALPSAGSLGSLQSMGVTPRRHRDSPWLLVKTILMGPVGICMSSKSCSSPAPVQAPESTASARKRWVRGSEQLQESKLPLSAFTSSPSDQAGCRENLHFEPCA